jgi:hypothetical protein
MLRIFSRAIAYLVCCVFFLLIQKSHALGSCHQTYLPKENRLTNPSALYFPKNDQKKTFDALLKSTGIAIKPGCAGGVNTQQQALLHNIVQLVDETQKKWVRRVHGADRWNMVKKTYMNPGALLGDLKKLGFVQASVPASKNSDCLCILGSTGPSMSVRIQYAHDLLNRGHCTKHIVLLAGERPLNPKERSQKVLRDVSKHRGRPVSDLTESDLIHYLYHQSPLSKKGIPVTLIDTPRGDLPRPTTQTTAVQLIAWLNKNPSIHNVVFVSTQPHVAYQKSCIDMAFRLCNKKDVACTVVGNNNSNNDCTQVCDAGLQALGSYIWAVTVQILSEISWHCPVSKEIKQGFRRLYAHNPMAYGLLPRLLRDEQSVMTPGKTPGINRIVVKKRANEDLSATQTEAAPPA